MAQDAHAELQHQLTTAATAREQAEAEAEQLRADGTAKVALLEDFELRFRQQQRCGAFVHPLPQVFPNNIVPNVIFACTCNFTV